MKKKLWFPIYTWTLNVSAVNVWRPRKRMPGKPYLPFLRELVGAILTMYGSLPVIGWRSVELPLAVREYIR